MHLKGRQLEARFSVVTFGLSMVQGLGEDSANEVQSLHLPEEG